MENRIYVADLERYNSGRLVGQWFDLGEHDIDSLKEGIKAMLDKNNNEEYAIHDYELPFTIGEYENLDTLMERMEFFNGLEEWELEKFNACCEMTSDVDEVIEKFDSYNYYPDIKDHEDLGLFYIKECDGLAIPDYIESYFDYEKYGRDCEQNENSIFCDNGGYVIFNG